MALTPEQIELRKRGVFASDMPRVARLIPRTWERSGWRDLYNEKVGAVPPWEGNAKTRRGELVEPLIAQTFSEATGIPVTRNGTSALHPEIPFIGATADYATPEGLPVECKNVGTFMAKRWAAGVPDYVEVQVQTQLAVLGKPRGYVAAWLEGSEKLVDVFEVTFKPDIWAHLVTLSREFWNHVEQRIPPED